MLFPPLLFLLVVEESDTLNLWPDFESSCFSTDTWLTTPTGKKRMDDIVIGDEVLTANGTHSFYAPITVWMKRDPEITVKFTTLMTEYGKMLAVTPNHLVLMNKCNEDYDEYVETLPDTSDAVFAKELVKGDCLVLLYKGKWRQQRLLKITKTKRKGLFAPLTSNGRIIVNDIIATCYSGSKEWTLNMLYYEAQSMFRQWLSSSQTAVVYVIDRIPSLSVLQDYVIGLWS